LLKITRFGGFLFFGAENLILISSDEVKPNASFLIAIYK